MRSVHFRPVKTNSGWREGSISQNNRIVFFSPAFHQNLSYLSYEISERDFLSKSSPPPLVSKPEYCPVNIMGGGLIFCSSPCYSYTYILSYSIIRIKHECRFCYCACAFRTCLVSKNAPFRYHIHHKVQSWEIIKFGSFYDKIKTIVYIFCWKKRIKKENIFLPLYLYLLS